MAICILGDTHFRADNPYHMKATEEFLKWFDTWSYNNSENHLILAGDVVHLANNGGIVISYLDRFIRSSKFQSVHIVVGNHDKKLIAGKWQVAYEFYNLREDSNVHIYEEETLVEIEGKKVLMCPYFLNLDKNNRTMKEAYSSIARRYNKLDAIVGHFGDPASSYGDGVECIHNLEKLEERGVKVCLGHTHNRVTPRINIGSVIAQSTAENDDRRAAWILKDNKWSEEPLPIFLEFLRVYYPEPLIVSKALVPVYTIFNCASEAVARTKYGDDVFFRKVLSNQTETSIQAIETEAKSVRNMDVKSLFQEFSETQKGTYPPEVLESCKQMLQ